MDCVVAISQRIHSRMVLGQDVLDTKMVVDLLFFCQDLLGGGGVKTLMSE